MSDAAQIIRDAILADPSLILDDHEVMDALLSTRVAEQTNVVDLRSVQLSRTVEKLGALEETHRSVIAAAYENVAGTQAVHRAILALLEPQDFGGFIDVTRKTLSQALGIDEVRLVIEADGAAADAFATAEGLTVLPLGGIDGYAGGDVARPIELRAHLPRGGDVFGAAAQALGSEALLRLDLGEGRRAAMLVFGAADPARFAPDQGTDLLAFLRGAYERILRRWIS